MAEVKLIFRDGEEPGTVDIDTEFNPGLTEEPTAAQFAAYFTVQWLIRDYFGLQGDHSPVADQGLLRPPGRGVA